MATSAKITIVGGGQAGLQLGCGLLDNGYDVRSSRTARPSKSRRAR